MYLEPFPFKPFLILKKTKHLKSMHLAFAMYEKMQEAGLIEIIPLICTFTGQGQYPDFPHPKSPQGATAAGAAGMMAATSFVPWDGRQQPLPTIHSQHVHRIEHKSSFFPSLSLPSCLLSSFPEILVEHLLQARNCSRCWEKIYEQNNPW